MDYHVVFFVVKFINFYHVVFHVASCSMEIHMVNHVVGLRCRLESAIRFIRFPESLFNHDKFDTLHTRVTTIR